MKWGSPNTTPGIRHEKWRLDPKYHPYEKPWYHGKLTRADWLVTPAVTGGPVFKVVVAVVRPQAAVVEAEDVIDPVGLSRNTRRFPEWRWAPVVCSVWGAASNRVCCQDLSTGAVVTTLLSCCILRTVEKSTKYCYLKLLFKTARGVLSGKGQ